MACEFDIVAFLESPEDMAAYLDEMMADGDLKMAVMALGDVLRALGMSEVSERTGLNRVSLYRSLREGRDVKISTLSKVLDVLDLRLTVTPKHEQQTDAAAAG